MLLSRLDFNHVVFDLFLAWLQMFFALAYPDSQVVFAAFHFFFDLLILDALVEAASILREIVSHMNYSFVFFALGDEIIVKLPDELT